MLYGDLRFAKEAYEQGDNITALLREKFSVENNTPEIIEIAYDLQAGSYADSVKSQRASWENYTGEISAILLNYCSENDSMLDVGTGEMTTLAGVAKNCNSEISNYYACDISWSRLNKGKEFVAEELSSTLIRRIHPVVADLFHLPFVDGAIDVVWTSHALEPNGGREWEAVTELLRVSRKKLILFEPCYEKNSAEGQARMKRLGYIKGLADVVEKCGASCEDIIPLQHISNPLNPTHAFIISPPPKTENRIIESPYACPATQLPMIRQDDCFWSEYSMLAYPILGGIPILRQESAVLASALNHSR